MRRQKPKMFFYGNEQLCFATVGGMITQMSQTIVIGRVSLTMELEVLHVFSVFSLKIPLSKGLLHQKKALHLSHKNPKTFANGQNYLFISLGKSSMRFNPIKNNEMSLCYNSLFEP